MNTLRALPGYVVAGLTVVAVASVGCEAHERVVVRDRPAVVRVVAPPPPPPPVVQERVIIRP